GIESGDPTKAQEFKNKTSKEVDLILCEEMEWSQLGAVVHYDPRVEWNSHAAEMQSNLGRSPMFPAAAVKADWEKKKLKIPERLRKLGPRIKAPADSVLEAAFISRSKVNMVGDHDLFAFTKPGGDEYGVFMPDTDVRVARAQKALQNKSTFQAQHGG